MEISLKRVSCLSSLGFIIVFALACASSGCAMRDGETCTFWSDCGDDAPDGDDEPGDTFDPDFPEVVVAPPAEDPEPEMPEGPSVPMAAPILSLASVPTNILSYGQNTVLRFTITANAASDVIFRKFAFTAAIDSEWPLVAYWPRLRRVGEGAALPAVADEFATGPWHCGDDVDAASYSCYRIALAQPLVIPAGTSVTLELLMDVDGGMTEGDSITTFLFRYSSVAQEGPLTGSGLDLAIVGGHEDGILWSNDGAWFYDGNEILGSSDGQILARP